MWRPRCDLRSLHPKCLLVHSMISILCCLATYLWYQSQHTDWQKILQRKNRKGCNIWKKKKNKGIHFIILLSWICVCMFIWALIMSKRVKLIVVCVHVHLKMMWRKNGLKKKKKSACIAELYTKCRNLSTLPLKFLKFYLVISEWGEKKKKKLITDPFVKLSSFTMVQVP